MVTIELADPSVLYVPSYDPVAVTGANLRAEGELEFGKCDLGYE